MLVSELPTTRYKGAIPDQILYKLLSEGQYLEAKQLKTALEKATSQKNSLYDALIELDLVSDENLGKLYADFLKLPFISLSKVSIPDETLQIVPEIVARKQKIIVFEKNKDGLKLATSNPENKDPIEFISKKSGEKITVYFATERDLDNALALYKKQLTSAFDELLKEQIEKADKGVSEAPISKIVDLLITYAYDNKASDIHIEPRENDTSVRFRIDGVLHDVLNLPKKFHDQVITRIKVLSKLRTDEHLKAQDGKLQMNMEKEEVDVRVSIVPVVDGEKCVMR
ncbi:Flp pilus assembly complex ATPase component TadA, partial [Candidatus Daviesbacteria bacterium]|nr:Flp pilus assembly complex ATPase component TadA [Candidatus Daviesbacteria bacterium]